MTINPEVQAKAQEEIERVVGTDRLPTAEDRENLPYVEAVFLETLRWHNVAPLAIPHRTVEDDVYEGYFFPKGTIFIANVWKMLHDSETYPDPFTFNPERFVKSVDHEPETDPRTMVFGFGRRSVPAPAAVSTSADIFFSSICPGMQLADASIWLSIAMTLAVFKVSRAVVDGKVIEPAIEFTAGTVRYVAPLHDRPTLPVDLMCGVCFRAPLQPPRAVPVRCQAPVREGRGAHPAHRRRPRVNASPSSIVCPLHLPSSSVHPTPVRVRYCGGVWRAHAHAHTYTPISSMLSYPHP